MTTEKKVSDVSDPQHRDTDWFAEWDTITNDEGQPEHDDNITDSGDAERRIWVVRRLRSDLAEIDNHAAQEIERVEAWANEQRAKIARQTEWLEAGLLAHLKATGKKTLKLVSGTLKWRDFLSHKTTVKPDKKAILHYIKVTGELPEGADLERGPGSFTIETEHA